jgi:hypothetical protein
MSRRRATFQQCDLDRAIRSVLKTGATSYEVVIEGPRVTVRVPGNPQPPEKSIAQDKEIVL